MKDIVDRLLCEYDSPGGDTEDLLAEAASKIMRLRKFEKLDAEAATHVETVIVMRTDFTGEPPYVGWKGLGLALTEKLDADKAEIERLRAASSSQTSEEQVK